MSETDFDLDAYLHRIGIAGRPAASLDGLRAVVAGHAGSIPYENLDVLLGRPPRLDLATLQSKLVRGGRGGYCFEQNLLLRAGLRALGFITTGLIARVVRGFPADAPRFAAHMVLRVDLPEGVFLADVGFGNLSPTAPLALQSLLEQETPHETMRLLPVGSELALQAKLGNEWDSLWRLCAQVVLDVDYEVANWFTATHPASPFVSNMIAARAGPNGTRHTFLNGRLNLRMPDGTVERQDLPDDDSIQRALASRFQLQIPADEVRSAVAVIARAGQHGAPHHAFS
jgi:N-hydroxyarylamine O-acetyltransferase